MDHCMQRLQHFHAALNVIEQMAEDVRDNAASTRNRDHHAKRKCTMRQASTSRAN
jgi:hypothetical protein